MATGEEEVFKADSFDELVHVVKNITAGQCKGKGVFWHLSPAHVDNFCVDDNVCACAYAFVCACACGCVCVCAFVCACCCTIGWAYVCTCAYVCANVCAYVSACACASADVCAYVSACAYTSACVFAFCIYSAYTNRLCASINPIQTGLFRSSLGWGRQTPRPSPLRFLKTVKDIDMKLTPLIKRHEINLLLLSHLSCAVQQGSKIRFPWQQVN